MLARRNLLIVFATFVILQGLALTSLADDGDSAPPPAPLSSSALMSGPSLRETGRIGGIPVGTGETIQPVVAVVDTREKSIAPAAATVGTHPPPRVGTIDGATLQREIHQSFARLDDCRIDAARRVRIAPGDVRADSLTLRWTIQPDGKASMTEVVATTPTDIEVMNCVKITMRLWTFTRPLGGPLPVERDFKFRPVP
jgi:hypothetical protein